MSYVLTSLSGNLISAASAGYAPTNSAEVSAIASAYQVVSATATQLNAGTAYLTSVNDTPISASRAGNAANASLANSAWYDGTGRFISSLPDEATVSSIASAYAESQVSGKLDATASAGFYTTANESGYVDSAYVESAVSGKQDTLTFDWDADSAISSINGSALAGNGGVDESAVSAIASAYAESAASGKQASGNYISATGLNQYIGNSNATQRVAFGSLGNAGIYLTGQFSTAYYKDNELKIGRNKHMIAFTCGGVGARISAMGAGMDPYMNLYRSGGTTGEYSVNGFTSRNSVGNTVAKYGSAEYTQLTSMYDTVSANSASWGGSALALSAGPGVKLEKVGDTLVAGLDRTLLWSGTRNLSATGTWALSGNPFDYEQVQIWARPHNTHKSELGCTVMPNLDSNSVTDVCIMGIQDALTHVRFNIANLRIDSSGFYVNSSKQISVPDATANTPTIVTMVYGLNRTAGV